MGIYDGLLIRGFERACEKYPDGAPRASPWYLHYFRAESAEAIPSFAKALACQRTCLPARSVSAKAGSASRSEGYPSRIHPRLKPWSSAKADKEALIYIGEKFTYRKQKEFIDRFSTA